MNITNKYNISELDPEQMLLHDGPFRCETDRLTVEIATKNASADFAVVLMLSASSDNFAQPHPDAAIAVPGGTGVTVIPFTGITPGTFVDLKFIKQTATAGTFDATLV